MDQDTDSAECSPKSCSSDDLHGDAAEVTVDVHLLACGCQLVQVHHQSSDCLIDGAGICLQVVAVEHWLDCSSQAAPQGPKGAQDVTCADHAQVYMGYTHRCGQPDMRYPLRYITSELRYRGW